MNSVDATNGKATIKMDATWQPKKVDRAAAGPRILWKIENKAGGAAQNWSAVNGNLLNANTTSTWTDLGGAPNRDFSIYCWLDRDGNGIMNNDEEHRLLYVTILALKILNPVDSNKNGKIDDPGISSTGAAQNGNEFSFSSATPGILRIVFQIQLLPDTATIRSRFSNRIECFIERIGSTKPEWDHPASGRGDIGYAVYDSSTSLWRATVTFSGLPRSNSDFGVKQTNVEVMKTGSHHNQALCRREVYIEVFFPLTAKNNPKAKDPNWYYYWTNKQNPIFATLSKFKQVSYVDEDGLAFHEKGKLELWRDAVEPCQQFIVAHKQTGALRRTGASSAATSIPMDALAARIEHEYTHYVNWQAINILKLADTDSDRIADSIESSLGTVVGLKDTYDLASYIHEEYADYGDNELMSRDNELTPGQYQKTMDWSKSDNQKYSDGHNWAR